jgi:altronate hydrolase
MRVMENENKLFLITDKDNVAVALKSVMKDETVLVNGQMITAKDEIPTGHKMALADVMEGEDIIKYGFSIGKARADIHVGDHVHTHNVKTGLHDLMDYAYDPKNTAYPVISGPDTFMGYRRRSGKVGIRNEMWIVPTVGCVNGVAELIIRKFKERVNPEGIDAIEVFSHNYGCSQLGDDHENTRTILADLVNHPNAGGVLVLGLGCENNTMDEFMKALGDYDEERTRFIVTQQVGNEIEEGIRALTSLYEKMKEDRRVEVPVSELSIGLKCGGSDGFSGITANPLLGRFSDYLVEKGGTTILTEVPEMFGAETILMDRAENEEVFGKIVDLINDFKQYFIDNRQPIYENPSPGNKSGGISTLEDKSLGCTQKGGSSLVKDVLKYGEVATRKGLNLLSAPGNDLVASTALGASGCHMVLFTTGRGTPFGSFVPTIKISSNSRIAELKPHWIDFNAGQMLEGKPSEEMTREFIDYVISVASGELANNEKSGFREISIFKTGVTL